MTDSEQAADNALLRRQLDAAREREAEARRAVGLLNAIIEALPVGVTVQAEDGAVLLESSIAAALSKPAAADVALPAASEHRERTATRQARSRQRSAFFPGWTQTSARI